MQLDQIELWLDMQLSPHLAAWITDNFSIKATSTYTLLLNTEKDEKIFLKAKELRNVYILTKDKDFSNLQARLLAPPKIILLQIGNTSNEQVKNILSDSLLIALEELINTATELVEIKSKNTLQ